MNIDISLFMCSRIAGNPNSRLVSTLESIIAQASQPQRVEVWVKFDEDDQEVPQLLEQLKRFENKAHIHYLISPRGAGYSDLHKAYHDLLVRFNPASKIYWILSDDVEIRCAGWDDYILENANRFNDGIFIMHAAPLVNYEKVSRQLVLETSDPYPIFSKNWVTIANGFGYTFAIDAWAGLLEQELITQYGVDRRIYLDKLSVSRVLCENDKQGSSRFDIVRKQVHDLLLTAQVRLLIQAVARNIYLVAAQNDALIKQVQRNYLKNKAIVSSYLFLQFFYSLAKLFVAEIKKRFFVK